MSDYKTDVAKLREELGLTPDQQIHTLDIQDGKLVVLHSDIPEVERLSEMTAMTEKHVTAMQVVAECGENPCDHELCVALREVARNVESQASRKYALVERVWTEFVCGAMDSGYLCNLPPRHTCAHIAFAGPTDVAHCWLSAAPPTGETKP